MAQILMSKTNEWIFIKFGTGEMEGSTSYGIGVKFNFGSYWQQ
jgi:hypothetical protein